ncbi:MAG TPA: glycosyltransferase family 39 protein, partial [Cytophagaceae bacterium]|nr:glycosyltransferase family 39 protein [Cytophagaceae bacterium]
MLYKFLSNFRVQTLVIIIFSLLLYGNTYRNTYALDDDIIIIKNLNVQKGFTGIKKILTTDAFQGYMDMMQTDLPLTGGRYRPLSIVTFAMEQQIFGETNGEAYIKVQKELTQQQAQNVSSETISALLKQKDAAEASIIESNSKITTQRHIVQIILFALSMVILLYFLTHHVFPSYPLLGFFTVLLFVAHPVHTEVVANLKSRDEILSLMFISLTGIYCFRYHKEKSTKNLLLCSLCFVAALLSKEYAIVLPFVLMGGMYIFHTGNFNALFNTCVKTMLAILFFFMVVRFSAFHKAPTSDTIQDVLNAPYLYASSSEKIATKISIVLQYARVLIYPKNLSYDYSYNQLPYLNFSNWQTWISIMIYGSLFFLTWHLVKKRHIIGFAFLFFLSFFMLVNNLLFNIGATMGERLIYHSSLGFCMIVVWISYTLLNKLKINQTAYPLIVALLCLVVLSPLTAKTIDRNLAWSNDYTLDTTDVHYVSGSASANNNAGSTIYNEAFKKLLLANPKTAKDTVVFEASIHEAIDYLKKAASIHPKYFIANMNLGMCYYNLQEYKIAAGYWVKAAKLYHGPHPTLQVHSRLFLDKGLQLGHDKKYAEAIVELTRAARIYPYDAGIWNNLGGSLYMAGR